MNSGTIKFIVYFFLLITIPYLGLWKIEKVLVYLTFIPEIAQPAVKQVLVGMVIAFQLLVVVFFAATPIFAGLFVSTVDNPMNIWFLPQFAKIENGRAKAIVDIGGNAVRYIINKHDAGFIPKDAMKKGDSKTKQWEVVDDYRGEGYGEEFHNGRNIWERWVEDKTGLVFVGIFPWRRVYHYSIHPIKILTREGERKLDVGGADKSDHVRVREFNWGAGVTAPLKDLFGILIWFSFRLQCVNPHKMLFGIDSWDESFADAVASRVNELVQGRTLDNMLAMGATAGKSWIAEEVQKISDTPGVKPGTRENWGFDIIEAQISRYDFITRTEDEKKALTAKQVAKRLMAARAIEYKTEQEGEKGIVAARAEAIEQHPNSGVIASRDQMLETVAEKGAQTIITGLGTPGKQGAVDDELTNVLKALLAQISKNNEKQ